MCVARLKQPKQAVDSAGIAVGGRLPRLGLAAGCDKRQRNKKGKRGEKGKESCAWSVS